ncbi:MAG: flagellar biosynthetic protein FlhB [Pseudohongiellaceae bacterium]|jgi:flagellar biosynthetic protein FlhB
MAEGNDSSAEKSEEPTQKRLDKAREDGETVRSKELNTTAIMLAGASGLLLFGPSLAMSMVNIMTLNFSFRVQSLDEAMMFSHLSDSIGQALLGCVPIFLLLMAAAMLSPALLGGWNFSFKSISPKASRMNPMSGLGRMFGPKALIELAKAIAKVVVVGSVAALVLFIDMDAIRSLQRQPVLNAMTHALTLLGWAFLLISAAMLIITAIDVPIQIYQHTQKLRMTLQQVKDEMKDSDGRPEIKQKIRQLQQQMANNRMMQEMPSADVVITNPDHYSVALRYDQGKDSAPVVVAKGLDFMAFKIREVASEYEIPIVSAPPLARAVYFNSEVGDEIPAGLYVAVAQVLAYIYQLRRWAKGQAKKPKLDGKYDIPVELQHD